MLILHAAFEAPHLLVWGEGEAEESSPAKRRGRPPKVWRPLPHPFSAPAALLAEAASPAGESLALTKTRVVLATVWLPTSSGKPLPSSPLLGEIRGEAVPVVLTAWSVPALPLDGRAMVEWLAACMDKASLAPGVLLGTDVAFWCEALRLAGAIVARGQVLPAVERNGEALRAAWKSLLLGSWPSRAATLAARMPPSARALSREAAPSPPEARPASVLEAFLDGAVDALFRPDAPQESQPRSRLSGRLAFSGNHHEAWLNSLKGHDPFLALGLTEGETLREEVARWREPLAAMQSSPVRLCFRLQEPPKGVHRDAQPGDQEWRVDYLLHPHEDPSLLVPVEDVFRPRTRASRAMARLGADPKASALAFLGQASALCPSIAASLKVPRPSGLSLDAAGAYEFLARTAPLLEQADFGLFLPAWWTGAGARERLALTAHAKVPVLRASQGLSLESLVQVEWSAALGGEPLSYRELSDLAALKAPLVRLRGQWVTVDSEQIQKALALMKDGKAAKTTVRDLMAMSLGAASPAGLPVASVAAKGELAAMLDTLAGGETAVKELPPPGGFSGTLRPYQLRGYAWLASLAKWGLGACLADDMGLGKTIQALAMIQRDWEGGERDPVLLVCPTSVVGNWQREAARFTPGLPVLVHHGAGRRSKAAFEKEARRTALVITSYGLLHREAETLAAVPWRGVILDEAQNIKNPQAKQAQAARALKAGYRLALTGTPVENHVGDLWALMAFLNPGLLGTQAAFRRTFFLPVQTGSDPEAAARLKRVTGPFILRRLKTDKAVIRDLPEKQEMKVFCTLTKEQASLYQAVLDDVGRELSKARGIQRKGLVLSTLLRLKQACNHPAHLLGDGSSLRGRSGKLARLEEMLEEVLAANDKALVFTQFTEMGTLLQRYLQETFGREVLFLHGGTPRGRRDTMVERFQQRDGPPLFLLSLKAGGTGLNLTAASHVFHFDRWWNPAVENQATDRSFRIGQKKNVQVHKFVCAGTLEEKIDAMIERKKAVAQRVVGAGETWLTELNNDELRALFALEPGAVAE
ncbi:MAG: SNF2-related protein [Acidobacteriota bacterium]